MNSTSKKTTGTRDFYLGIISYVNKNHKLPVMNLSKQARNYHIRKLKIDSVLIKRGYGTWEADIDKFEQISFLKEVKKSSGEGKNIRGHGFHFRIRLPKISNWHNKEQYLKKRKIKYVTSKANWEGFRIIVKKHKIWLTNKSIIIYSPRGKSYFESTAKASRNLAIYNLKQLLIRLENLLNINIKFSRKYHFRISKQHYGKVKDQLAHQVNKEGKKINCFFNGEQWLTIDRSLNEDEIETLHPKDAVPDMDHVVVPFLNSIKANPGMTLNEIKEMILGVTQNQVVFDSNMKSHISAVQDLGKGVKRYNKLLDKLLKKL